LTEEERAEEEEKSQHRLEEGISLLSTIAGRDVTVYHMI